MCMGVCVCLCVVLRIFGGPTVVAGNLSIAVYPRTHSLGQEAKQVETCD